MADINISELYPAGYDLFYDSESFLNELATQERQMVEGGFGFSGSFGFSGGFGNSGGFSNSGGFGYSKGFGYGGGFGHSKSSFF